MCLYTHVNSYVQQIKKGRCGLKSLPVRSLPIGQELATPLLCTEGAVIYSYNYIRGPN